MPRLEDTLQDFVGQTGAVVFHIQGQPGAVSRLTAAFPQRNVNSADSRHGFGGVLDQVHQDARKVFAGHAHRYGATSAHRRLALSSGPAREASKLRLARSSSARFLIGSAGSVFPLPRTHSRGETNESLGASQALGSDAGLLCVFDQHEFVDQAATGGGHQAKFSAVVRKGRSQYSWRL